MLYYVITAHINFSLVVTVGFGSDGITVDESTGMFMMCVVKDREALQDITVTIAAQDVTAITDLGEHSQTPLPYTQKEDYQVYSLCVMLQTTLQGAYQL